ncbi:N-acetyltransferase [Erythrobacter sp. SCSIO 43205]|uniref:GNAT family N-acetyltransferase n=1 Tax=Erythrobacter sp. SCSIO 43205 TaxID=2779361 RepID=UPI001CA9A47C|nr:GNAT family N-acetyltransferase [Erythrobacter sp. SCSIO 43205]UAB78368.1 N-acetyltransferase [Erythrobacter sp. SCSIO 43205]
MDDITITHEPSANGGKYIATLASESATGHLDWEPQGEGVRVATHTIVPKEIGGRGVAAVLVKALIKDAKEQGFKVVPQCWYVAKKFDENPEWEDLRAG